MIFPYYFDDNFGTKFPEGWGYVMPHSDPIVSITIACLQLIIIVELRHFDIVDLWICCFVESIYVCQVNIMNHVHV